MQEMEQHANVQSLPTDRNMLNKLMSLQHPGLNNQMGHNSPNMANRGALSGSTQAAVALTTGYQNMLMRQGSMNSTTNSLQQEASSFSNSSQSPSAAFQGTKLLPSGGYSSPNLPSQQRAPNGPHNLLAQNPNLTQGNPSLQQQQMVRQFLQEMSNNSDGGGGVLQAQSRFRSGTGFENNNSAPPQALAQPSSSNILGQVPGRSNSFKGAASNRDTSSTPAAANNGYINTGTVADMPQGLHLPDDIVSDIAQGFADNGFFSGDLDDTMGFGWKS